MAHKEQTHFCQKVKTLWPRSFKSKKVLEIGSFNVNGTVRDLFDSCDYLALDISEGKCVDVVCPAQDFDEISGAYDTIISCECFEHNPYYLATIYNAIRMLKPGGLFLFTCAGVGRPVHGVASLEEKDNPNWVTMPNASNPEWDNEYYKNLEISDISSKINLNLFFSEYGFEVNNNKCDLYFWGIKKC